MIAKRRLGYFLPLLIFLCLAAVFLARLFSGDPSTLPSALVGKKAPSLALPGIDGLTRDGAVIPGFSGLDLTSGRPVLVNVFASWCVPCHQEHPHLMALAAEGKIQIFGINQKDKPENARRFLGRLGNPYAAVGVDSDGRASIEWGVYGVPETFLVGGDGQILAKHVGPLTPEIIAAKFVPLIR